LRTFLETFGDGFLGIFLAWDLASKTPLGENKVGRLGLFWLIWI